VWLDDVPVTSLRDNEVGPAIRDWWQRYKTNSVTVIVSSSPFDTTVEQLGYRVDVEATVNAAQRLRKSGFWKLRRDYKSRRIAPVARLDGTVLNAVVDDLEKRAVANRPADASLGFEKGAIVVHAGQPGEVVDRQAAGALILARLGESNPGSIRLPLVRIEPKPDPSSLELLRTTAERLTKSAVLIESVQPPMKIRFLRSDLGQLIRIQHDDANAFRVVFDADVLGQLLHTRHINLDWPAKNATLEVTADNHFLVVPEALGYHVSALTLADRLLELANTSSKRGTIEFEKGEPAKLKAADVEHLRIRELMGSFTTRHPCCQPRVKNIHRIADLLDGVIVLPGATFSVNEAVGPRSIAGGFVMAPSIEDGEMVETIGGGVSQFATTFYNALLRAGLEIMERRAHTYWFDRYPMGHEATLSIPRPDLVFRNDTKSGVLIKTEYTEKSITVKLYGDKEGRKVAFGVSGIQEVEQPPVERLPNPDIAPDKEHKKSSGRIGWSVMTWRTVTLSSGEVKKDERKVTYKPQVRRVEVHPCRLKPDEPGYTGEPCPKVETTGTAEE
jgi:vancomycin resistance protein YoaR